MKKAVSILAALALVFTLAGCGAVPMDDGEIKTLKMQDADQYENATTPKEMTVGGPMYRSWVSVDPNSFDEADIKFVVMDEQTVKVTPGTKTAGALWFECEALAPGKTGFYAQTKDGKVKSEVLTVFVTE